MLESNKNEELHNRAAPFDYHIDEFIEFLNFTTSVSLPISTATYIL